VICRLPDTRRISVVTAWRRWEFVERECREREFGEREVGERGFGEREVGEREFGELEVIEKESGDIDGDRKKCHISAATSQVVVSSAVGSLQGARSGHQGSSN